MYFLLDIAKFLEIPTTPSLVCAMWLGEVERILAELAAFITQVIAWLQCFIIYPWGEMR
jgi:hypothetical protein